MSELDLRKKAYLVSLKHKLKLHLNQQKVKTQHVDSEWMNGFLAAGYHSGLADLVELKFEYMNAHRTAHGKRMSEAQERQLELRLANLCRMAD